MSIHKFHESYRRDTLQRKMYKIVKKSSAAALLDVTKSLLLATGERGVYALGQLENLARDPLLFGKNYEQFFATVESENGIAAISYIMPPFAHNSNLFCFSQNPPFVKEIVSSLVNYLYYNWNRDLVSGIFSECGMAEKWAEEWTLLSGKKIANSIHQAMYSLSNVLIQPSTTGSLKIASSSDFELLLQWSIKCRQENFTESDKERLQKRISQGKMFLWKTEEGIPVSMAGIPRNTENSVYFGAVYTPPEFRKRGYATSLVATLSQKCLDEGYERCILFADLANPTSNKIYQKIGFQKIGEYLELSF